MRRITREKRFPGRGKRGAEAQRPACAGPSEDSGEAGGAKCRRRAWPEKSGDAENVSFLGRVLGSFWAQWEGLGGRGQAAPDWVLGERSCCGHWEEKGEAGEGSCCEVLNSQGSARRWRQCLGWGVGEQARKWSYHLLPCAFVLKISRWV